jgi:hypothetical protein
MSSTTRTRWNPTTHDDYNELKNVDVFTSDDEKIGTIEEVLHPASGSTSPTEHYFRVDPGFFDKLTGDDEMYVRASMVEFVSDDRVVIETPKDRIESTDWTAPGNMDSYKRY